MKLYKIKNCEQCAQVEIDESLDIKTVFIDSEDYNGFAPDNVPILQVSPGFNVNGKDYINNFLNTIKSAQDGLYKK
jgi:hypothetical protein